MIIFYYAKADWKIYLIASLEKTRIYLKVSMKLLRIKSKAEFERASESDIIGETPYLYLPHKSVVQD